MTMQILDIVLYNRDGDMRVLNFNIGKLNIITGSSKTGKTALIDIIDYCMASKSCDIAEGVIRQTVSWVGIHLVTETELIFVARKIPHSGNNSSSEIYYEIQSDSRFPEFSELSQNMDPESLKRSLSSHLGIHDYEFEPPEGQTRRPLRPNIKHSLFYIFQQQSEIISRRHLFHKQSEPFVPQAIKDTLPYFLGAVDDDFMSKKDRLRKLSRDLKIKKQKLSEFKSISSDGISKAQILLHEANNLGFDFEIPNDFNECLDLLNYFQKNPFITEKIIYQDEIEIEKLEKERSDLVNEFNDIRNKLKAIESMYSDKEHYSQELKANYYRLKSINLFNSEANGSDHCPICNAMISESIPNIQDIEAAVNKIQSEIPLMAEKSPQMEILIREMNFRLDEIKNELNDNKETLESIRESNQKFKNITEVNSQRSYLLGKVDLYLESLKKIHDDEKIMKEISIIKEEINVLKHELSDERIKELIDSFLSQINDYMGEWAKKLKLEHSKYPLRLDVNKLTIVADTKDGPIPMSRMGSGENWVGYHIIVHLALHKWFIVKDRPVPRFLFIDQPSQVYFPQDTHIDGDVEDEDVESVKRMYSLVNELVNELSPAFQVIITDHADINEEWFQASIIERWRDGSKLVPESWYNK